jgi:hypothetical protein
MSLASLLRESHASLIFGQAREDTNFAVFRAVTSGLVFAANNLAPVVPQVLHIRCLGDKPEEA